MTQPRTVEELAVPRKLVEDLFLKTLFIAGELTLVQLAEQMAVDCAIVEDVFARLRRDQLLQVTGMVAGSHQMVITSDGKTRALELLSGSAYVGPVPVSLEAYVERVGEQSVRRLDVHAEDLTAAFAHLVVDPQTLTQLGTAVVSGRAIFLHGPPGTGKTTVAEALWLVYQNDHVWVPHAVVVDGQIIAVYDRGVHRTVESPPGEHDRRWVRCRRPKVMVGGELTIEMLELQMSPTTRYYEAPLQVKANNGLLVIDDFGRQRVRAEELLSRWIVPLDRGIDFLALAGGRKIEVPFDCLVVFATNIDPNDLVDEAFRRRIQTKIKLDSVAPAHFREIMKRVCDEYALTFDAALTDELIAFITHDLYQPLRACHPRDLVNQVCWAARYLRERPRFDRAALEQACRNYFLLPPDVRSSSSDAHAAQN